MDIVSQRATRDKMLLYTHNNEGWRLNVIIEVCVFSDIELECDDVTNRGKGDWMYEDRIISRKLEGNETAIFNGFQPKIICWTQRSLPSISSYSSIIFMMCIILLCGSL